jgi:hypothetical protein
LVEPTPCCATSTIAVPAVARSAAAIAAVSCVALTTVVAREAPPHRTVAPLTNPAPFTVSVNAAPPAVAVEGESDVSEGRTGAVTAKVNAADVSPLSVFTTVTGTAPTAAMLAAGIEADTCVVPSTVVAGIFTPFHATWAPLRNPVPTATSVNALPPATAVAGVREVIVGNGSAFTVKFNALVLVPSGLVTFTGIAAAASPTFAAVAAAVSCVELTYTVVRFVVPHTTVDPETNPAPLTVSATALPAAPLVGLIEEIDTAVVAGGVALLSPLQPLRNTANPPRTHTLQPRHNPVIQPLLRRKYCK